MALNKSIIKNPYFEQASDNLKYLKGAKVKRKMTIQEPYPILSKSGTVSDLGMRDKEVVVEDNLWKVNDLDENMEKIIAPEFEDVINGVIYNCNTLYQMFEDETVNMKNMFSEFTESVAKSLNEIKNSVNTLQTQVTKIENDLKTLSKTVDILSDKVSTNEKKEPRSSSGFTIDDCMAAIKNLSERVKVIENKI